MGEKKEKMGEKRHKSGHNDSDVYGGRKSECVERG
jgi:hypothetical protein